MSDAVAIQLIVSVTSLLVLIATSILTMHTKRDVKKVHDLTNSNYTEMTTRLDKALTKIDTLEKQLRVAEQ